MTDLSNYGRRAQLFNMLAGYVRNVVASAPMDGIDIVDFTRDCIGPRRLEAALTLEGLGNISPEANLVDMVFSEYRGDTSEAITSPVTCVRIPSKTITWFRHHPAVDNVLSVKLDDISAEHAAFVRQRMIAVTDIDRKLNALAYTIINTKTVGEWCGIAGTTYHHMVPEDWKSSSDYGERKRGINRAVAERLDKKGVDLQSTYGALQLAMAGWVQQSSGGPPLVPIFDMAPDMYRRPYL